jgi:hypothetical protein
MYAGHPVGSVAQARLKRVGVDGLACLDLGQQGATLRSEPRMVSWQWVIGQLQPGLEWPIFGCRRAEVSVRRSSRCVRNSAPVAAE